MEVNWSIGKIFRSLLIVVLMSTGVVAGAKAESMNEYLFGVCTGWSNNGFKVKNDADLTCLTYFTAMISHGSAVCETIQIIK